MSSSDFHEIVHASEPGKSERLFRASVCAFCALTRPARRDLVQLDALALPLYDSVSIDALRYVSAALSECPAAPPRLLGRLCDERVDICAPLLIRSQALGDVALIDLVARHGLGHARAIARRANLNPTIGQLIRALEAAAEAGAGSTEPQPSKGQAAEAIRDRLRAIMDGSNAETDTSQVACEPEIAFAELREAALTGDERVFAAVLATALRLTAPGMLDLLDAAGLTPLIVALRALGLAEEKAFLIAVIAFPEEFQSPQAVRLFLERYRGMDRSAALARVRGWKIELVAAWVQNNLKAGRRPA